jgi:ribosomal protein L37AE/L43A
LDLSGRYANVDGIDYSLLENGLDFLDSGVTQIAQAENPSDLKYAVLHLGAGIELIFKERLRREDWRLLFNNPAKAEEKVYESGNFRGINFHECLDRLEQSGINISDEARRKLESFYARRNRIQHFRFKETREAVESAAADVIGIVLDFIAEELDGENLSRSERQILASIRGRLADFQRFTAERLAAISNRVLELRGEYGDTIQCPSCLQETLNADCDVECPFCGYRDDAESAADLYIANVLGETLYELEREGGRYPHYCCPNCENEALVEDYDGLFLCFACGYRADGGVVHPSKLDTWGRV